MRNIILFFMLITISQAATHKPLNFLQEIVGKPHEGDLIVEHYCATCHAEKPLIAIGAPKSKLAVDWKLRLQQPVDLLMTHLHEGFNAMPARGGCFECSDKQLYLAFLALLPEDQIKIISNKKFIK